MKRRDHIIVVLAVVVAVLLALVEFVCLPQQRANALQYQNAQQDPQTHDLSSILPYKSKYMGDASNNGALFRKLPMNEFLNGFEQNPDRFELTVHYRIASTQADTLKFKRTVLYNAAASFALVQNLQILNLSFNDQTFTVTRATIMQIYPNLSNMLSEKAWKNGVQSELQNPDTVQRLFQSAVAEKAAV